MVTQIKRVFFTWKLLCSEWPPSSENCFLLQHGFLLPTGMKWNAIYQKQSQYNADMIENKNVQSENRIWRQFCGPTFLPSVLQGGGGGGEAKNLLTNIASAKQPTVLLENKQDVFHLVLTWKVVYKNPNLFLEKQLLL